ncbi:MAG: hypothetical protein GC160_10890 [Acidobacteria bacterium]|nr:hypothetical protein [Acidobacteriota bacterium]
MSQQRLEEAAAAGAFVFSVAGLFSIALSHLALGLTLALLLASRKRWRMPSIALPLGLFLGWTIVSAIANGHFAEAAPQFKKFYVFLALPVAYTLFDSTDRRRRLLQGWFVACFIAIAVGVAQFAVRVLAARAAGVDFGTFYAPDRITGFFSHWMTFSQAGLLVFLALVASLLFGTSVRRAMWTWRAVAVCLAAGLVLTFTRSVWLALLALAAYFVAQARPKLLWLAPIGVVALLAASPAALQQRVRSIGDASANAGRLLMWKTGARMIEDHPLFGVGPERVGPLFRDYLDPDVTELPPAYYGHLHSIYVHFPAERGLPALLFLLWLLGKILLDHARALRRTPPGRSDDRAAIQAGLAGTLAVLVVGAFDVTLGDSEVLALWLTLIAVGYAAQRTDSEPLRDHAV